MIAAVAAAAGMIAAALPMAAAGAEGSPYVVLAVAVLGSSATAAVISAWNRRKSGEGPAAAAKDLGEAMGHLIDGAEQLTLPLQRRIVELTTQVSDLTVKLADARIEVHEARKEAAMVAVELVNARFELESARVQLGQSPDRRVDPS